eukprot:CCRYP_019520-RA/>CCRYP_019520-RA protein AED:0.42 eAED:0.42 QI:0/0/0/1/0/0/4/0/407
MVRPEYMRLKLSDIPDHIIKLYKLDKLVTTDGYFHHTWFLETRLAPISFTLCVDDFGVKYVGIKHAHHLLQTLNNTTKRHKTGRVRDTSGSQSHGTIPSNKYNSPCQDTAKNPATVFTTLFPLNHSINPIPIHTHRTYGAKQQFVDTADDSALLSNTDKTFIQEVIGVFLYYTRAVDCTMLPALGSLATQQSAPTQNTMSKVHQFLDYAMTHPDAMIAFRASNMILAVHSDASYLSETKARSRAGGHFFLSEDNPSPCNNDAILNLAQIIKPVIQTRCTVHQCTWKQYHNDTFSMNWDIHNLQLPYKLTTPQPLEWSPTSSNQNAPKQWTCVFIGSIVEKIKTSFAPTGTTNLADYVTKHHPAIHHQAVRHIYRTTPTKLLDLRHKAHNILKVATTLPTLSPHACAA